MNVVIKAMQSSEKCQPVSLMDASSTILTNSIAINSEAEQQDVDGFLVQRINAVLKVGFQQDWTPQERAEVVNEYRRALRHHPKWLLAKAIDMAVRSTPNRPTPGNINSAAMSVSKSIRDELARRQRHEQREKEDRESIDRQKPDPATAQAILERAGFTAKRANTLRKRPMAASFAQVDAEIERPTQPHWTATVAPDSPQMEALRQARNDNALIQQARLASKNRKADNAS